MKKLKLFVGLILFNGSLLAAGVEPQKPQIDNTKLEALTSSAAYTAFIGDACNISHSISEQMQKNIRLIYTLEEQQQQMAAFREKKLISQMMLEFWNFGIVVILTLVKQGLWLKT